MRRAAGALSAAISAANSAFEALRTAWAARIPPRNFLLSRLKPPGDGVLCIPKPSHRRGSLTVRYHTVARLSEELFESLLHDLVTIAGGVLKRFPVEDDNAALAVISV